MEWERPNLSADVRSRHTQDILFAWESSENLIALQTQETEIGGNQVSAKLPLEDRHQRFVRLVIQRIWHNLIAD